MRNVQCEGGPWDGRYVEVREDIEYFNIPMRPSWKVWLGYTTQLLPTKSYIGEYRQDPLDSATFIWCGE